MPRTQHHTHVAAPVGFGSSLIARHIRPSTPEPITASIGWRLRNFLKHTGPDTPRLLVAHLARRAGVPVMLQQLSAKVIKADGREINYGVISTKFVTDAGVAFLVDAWQGLLEPEIMKYHGVGTDNTAENAADTTLGAECTTELLVNSTRATGSLAEGATGNIFRSVGTVTFDATVAVVEHGLFSQAATGGGTLWDRSVFSAVNVVSGDSIQFTYEATFTSGS